MIQYEVKVFENKLYINYYGKLFLENAQELSIRYGYTNEWKNCATKEMKKTDKGFEVSIDIKEYNTINFCFVNENEVWDNNNGQDYSVIIVKNKEKVMESDKMGIIKDNGLLLISEIQDKVFLPYAAREIEDIIESDENEYKTPEEVIENVFTKPFNYYRNQFTSRFKETVILITKRENMSLKDGIDLATEMFGKRYLHPAIISACKNLDELNVYLDCLEKNELDDFKIFDIKYEMRPMVVNNNFSKANILQKIANIFKPQTIEIEDFSGENK